MKFAISIAAATLAILPSAAMAQDKPAFDGWYAGVVAGYDHIVFSDGTDSTTKGGFTYGVVGGLDKQIDRLVIGAEGEIAGSTLKESQTGVFTAGDTLTAKAGRDWYLGVRFGAEIAPRTLVYGKIGYANGRVTIDYTAPGAALKVSDNLSGVRLGVGVERKFGAFSGRLEYRFTDYSNIKNNGVDTGVDAKRHQVAASLIARF